MEAPGLGAFGALRRSYGFVIIVISGPAVKAFDQKDVKLGNFWKARTTKYIGLIH